jgi:hypothetical protein
MPQPSSSDVHVNVPLTNVSIAWLQDQSNFIADTVFPVVPVNHKSDQYWIYDRFNWFKAKAELRAPATESAGDGWTLSRATYVADVYAIHKDVDDQIRANSDSAFDMDRDATEFVTRDIALTKDVTWAAKYFTTGVWASDVTPATLWDVEPSTPIKDITTEIVNQQRLTSFAPNTLVLTVEVWNVLKNNVDFISRINGGATSSTPAIVMPNLLAQVLGIDRVIIAQGVQNIAIEGAAEDMQFIFGKDALLVYAAPRASLLQPTAGYTFVWTRLTGSGTQIGRFRMDHLKSDRIEAEATWDQKVVSPEMGTFFSGVIS